ncbi:MAG: hypothetical protein KBG83_05375 [Bacteroidetes bacterium]|nr:hypothetical protein [Bacteroidota bacterium]
MTLEEKHYSAIENEVSTVQNVTVGRENAAKECAKITLEYCIDVLKEVRFQSDEAESMGLNNRTDAMTIRLQQQLSDLNK